MKSLFVRTEDFHRFYCCVERIFSIRVCYNRIPTTYFGNLLLTIYLLGGDNSIVNSTLVVFNVFSTATAPEANFSHRTTRSDVYVFLVSLPSALYGLLSVIFGFVMLDDDPIALCNPPASLNPVVKFYWYMTALVAGAITVCSYVLTYVALHYQGKRYGLQSTWASLPTVSVILLIFLFTRYLATVGANVLNIPNLIWSYILHNYKQPLSNVFAAMVCYSQNFYVVFWRSAEYRQLLWEQCCSLRHHRKILSESTGQYRRSVDHATVTRTRVQA
ncbi:unnamed protein product [Heligmosomoides polygyrus]|uniref:G_PROTEIN_RECEP_F1_2 domain-containing protein n=1 Tax=Heligmosomoides polygyrus TaxID=6339 RepID=A0A3P8DAU9_HELPZ|nr:unnamed protein product [Heligmosomoides polygyrus]